MAFLRAVCTRYETRSRADGTLEAIFAAGVVEDDTLTEQRYHEYWIMGDELAALPAADPLLEHTPADPRFQAIRAILAREAQRAYDRWMTEIAQRAVVEQKTPEEIAALPSISPEEAAAAAAQP